jgi:dextranase
VTLDARPERTSHRPGDDVVLLVDSVDAQPVSAVVTHLGDEVRRSAHEIPAGRARVSLGTLTEGSYAVRLTAADGSTTTTAVDVMADPLARPRYGFVTDFLPGRANGEEVADSLRAFHLNAVQFYDWMYRHAALLPPSDEFVDALDRSLSLASVRRLVAATHAAGAQALAYAAVYGAGREYADEHPEQVLRHRDGRPWMLGDFLWIMDVSRDSAWSRHVVAQMGEAVRHVGFDGLHLDQYGDPKVAATAAGTVVDLAEGFVATIEAVRAELPDATLIFNNVNDFPTTVTTSAPQDVTYIEVWSPHDDYADLVRLVDSARDRRPERPVVLAAYLAPFAEGSGPDQVAAAKLALSTVWSAGGQYLLFGEHHGALTHPYYPNYAPLSDDAVAVLRRFADFAVANGDLLYGADLHRSTRHLWLGVNEDVVVTGAPTALEPRAGAVWVRVATCGLRLVVTLVDLRSQEDPRWNVAKKPTGTAPGIRIRVRVASTEPSARFGHPLAGPELGTLNAALDGEHLEVEVPEFDTWAVVVVDR